MNLNLGNLALRSVDVDMGVGKLNLDLRGNPKKNYEVRFAAASAKSPSAFPITWAWTRRRREDSGSVTAPDMRREGNRCMHNSALGAGQGPDPPRYPGGIGSIRVSSD